MARKNKQQRDAQQRFRTFARVFFALVLACTLSCSLTVPSFAAIYGDDYVGTTKVNDRGLNITEAPAVDATCGILVDKDGNVLWSRNANDQVAMASITKTMTAIVALENGNLDDVYTVSAKAASVGESSAGLVTGQKVTLYDLLQGLLIHSGNDASMAIAEGIAGDEKKFVDLMNAKAQSMGLSNTHFENPHGLDADNHYSSAADISVIARYGMNNSTFRQIVGERTCTLNLNGEDRELITTNALLATWDDCIGVKTGYTSKAGQCLAAAANKNGEELYAIVLNSSDEVQRFIDAYKLLDWGFTHYRPYTLATASEVLVDVPMSGFINKTVKAGVANEVKGMVLDFNGDVSIDLRLSDIPDGVAEGDVVGTITWRQGETVVAYAPLVAKENRGGPAPWTSVFTAIVRCIGVLTKDQCVAQSVVYADTVSVERVSSTAGQGMDAALEKEIRSYVTEYNRISYGI